VGVRKSISHNTVKTPIVVVQRVHFGASSLSGNIEVCFSSGMIGLLLSL